MEQYITKDIDAAPESHPRQVKHEKVLTQKLTPDLRKSQEQLPKINKNGLELTDHCPYFYINEALANCHTVNWTEKALIGILNFYTGNWGYASISFEQLAHHLGLASGSVENMVSKLQKLKFIVDQGKYPLGKHRLVVCPAWRNPPKKKKQPANKDIPF